MDIRIRRRKDKCLHRFVFSHVDNFGALEKESTRFRTRGYVWEVGTARDYTPVIVEERGLSKTLQRTEPNYLKGVRKYFRSEALEIIALLVSPFVAM